ncbi:hypothetical protein [Methylobacterium gnaphalii]|uniref:hypothetical protein n=1 Tax=Methylobacterium gnaphalii TaxID=1010610 RepID=UPI00208C591C|nr:hypothetical protein [Methylobacterium gnaphalii]GJD70465.1 hypothetical protein MMMDOFMJ_3414 [Methylobacterium gnaphalii]GLS50747.1 hypothetical protein GCM10007885_36010 [Methylobacterium gnaphalii]
MVDLSSAPTIKVSITGAAAITSFGPGKHLFRLLTFADGGALLTHNATSLKLPGLANIKTQAGDRCFVTTDASGNATVFAYSRADGSALSYAGRSPSFRNRIRNGDFSVNQRAVSGTVTLAAFARGHDGWQAGSGGCTYTFATSAGRTTITITAGSLYQTIEGALYLPEGGTYTLSWGGTAQGRIYQGSAGAYAGSPVTASGLTAGTNTVVEFSTGTVSLAQLEPGNAPTPFEYRDDELRRCQRYFERVRTIFGGTAANGGAGIYITGFYKVTKAYTPTITNISVAASANLTSTNILGVDKDTFQPYGVSGGTGGYAFDASFYASAEL